MDAETK